MRLPGLGSDDAAVTNGLPRHKCTARLLGLEADMFIASDALVLRETGGGKHLDAMANGENPLLQRVEFTDQIE